MNKKTSKMSNPAATSHYDSPKGLKSRFLWVKRLLQSRTNPITGLNQRQTTNSGKQPSRGSEPLSKTHTNKQNQHASNSTDLDQLRQSTTQWTDQQPRQGEAQPARNINEENIPPQRTQPLVPRFDLGPQEADDSFDPSINHSLKASSKTPSIAHESINTRADNISTLPVISMSTASVRSSTFSEHSHTSTSGTILSDHPTVYTNSSTIGIPPASIMDRRERIHHPISLNNFHLTGTNNSSHTVNTNLSPSPALHNEYNDIQS